MAELVAPAEVAPPADAVVLDVRAFAGGVRVFAEGVYRAVVVSAFDPAEVEPLPEEVEAPAPLVPEAALDWM